MTSRTTLVSTLALGLLGSTLMPGLAHAVDVPVRYLAEEKLLRSEALAGTLLTFELYADSSCTTMLHSEDVAIDNLTISRLKVLRVKGAVKPPKAVELLYTLTGVAAPTGNQYTAVRVVGPGVVGIDRSCQPQAAVLLATTTTVTTSTTTTSSLMSDCYIDTGLTVIDTCNNLEWEKKDGFDGGTAGFGVVDAGNLHDVDNTYSWAGQCTLNTSVLCQPNAAAAATCTAQTGGAVGCAECGMSDGTCDVDPLAIGAITTIWDWVNQVNAASFAGHTDWRLATVVAGGDAPELESIVDASQGYCAGGSGACIDPIFGPTAFGTYWSASTFSAAPNNGWTVDFTSGGLAANTKNVDLGIRAVRPGS